MFLSTRVVENWNCLPIEMMDSNQNLTAEFEQHAAAALTWAGCWITSASIHSMSPIPWLHGNCRDGACDRHHCSKETLQSWECADVWEILRRDFHFFWTHGDSRDTLHLGTLCPLCRQLCRWLISWLWNVLLGQHRLKPIQLLKTEVLM